MKRKIPREVKIGFFSISMLLLLYLGINFIKSQNIFSNDNTLYAVYSQADGIEVSSPVLVKGFKVGTVEKIAFNIHTGNVIVKMSVKGEYPIPVNSKAKITSANILGGKVVEIQLGNDHNSFTSGDTIPSLFEPSMLQMAGDEYEKLKGMATTLIEQLSKALYSINDVLSKDNVANVSATLANLNTISSNLDNLIAKERGNISSLIENLNTMSASLKDTAPRLNTTLDKVNNVIDTVSIGVPQLLTSLDGTLTQINQILSDVQSGNGSAGKLLYDEQLYKNLALASQNLAVLLDDVKARPGRYINISVFGKKNQYADDSTVTKKQARKIKKDKIKN